VRSQPIETKKGTRSHKTLNTAIITMSASEVQILSTTVVTKQGGILLRCQHASTCCNAEMIFSIFLPHNWLELQDIPALYYLSGLTCTDQNVCQKAGATAFPAAESHGLALVMPDTSPRGDGVADDPSYDLGQGAGFYINAVKKPWAKHYQMETYITIELPAVILGEWSTVGIRKSIMGHSMGGHGALTLALKSKLADKNEWISVSALAPICHPTACPWGQKAFSNYLGSDGKEHDATELLLLCSKAPFGDVMIDQGTMDEFALAGQLLLEDFKGAAAAVGQQLSVRLLPRMDHSYYFIAACISDHIEFHSQQMAKS
jgi:S-formylglutathione hydrolase